MKEKGIKAEDVKNLPPIEEIDGLEAPRPPKVVKVNSLMKSDERDNPYNMHPSQCLYEFDNYIREQDHFNLVLNTHLMIMKNIMMMFMKTLNQIIKNQTMVLR